ncbi:hypothetical protein SMA75_24865, partial [Escherichia coli]
TLKMPAFEWVHVQLHQQKGMISLSPPTICNSALNIYDVLCYKLNVLTASYVNTLLRLMYLTLQFIYRGITIIYLLWWDMLL